MIKNSNIMKFYNLMATALFASVCTMMSCSQLDELDGQQPNNEKNYLQISVTDAGVYGDTPTRAVEDGYSTSFEVGDEIGVYGIEAGNLKIENRRVKLQGDGTWKVLGDPIEYAEGEMANIKFYAYYPYNGEGIDFNKSVELKEDPFEAAVSSWIIGTDLNENYTKYDLMTSRLTEITPENNMGRLDFKLNHRMSIASISLSGKVYKFQDGIDPYELPAEPKEFKLKQGTAEFVTVNPYYDEKNNSYRILVKPNVEYTISGTYALGRNKVFTQTRTVEEGIGEGKAVKFKVGTPIEIPHTLKVGDYYCADGSIVDKDVETAPENAIGVVYFVGNPQPSVLYADNATYTEAKDALKRDYPNCKHGLVIAIKNANDNSASKFCTGKNNSLGIGDWMVTQPELKAQYISSAKWNNAGIPEILGYNNTKIMDISYNEGTMMNLCNTMHEILDKYNGETVAPTLSTGWYCPSLGDFIELMNNYEDVKTSIENAKGELSNYEDLLSNTYNKTFYWASTERNGGMMFVTGLNQKEFEAANPPSYKNTARNSSNNTGFFRFCLAF